MADYSDNNHQGCENVIIERRRRDDNHEKHHRWIQEQIESERARKRMYTTITKVVLQWSIPAILGSILYWLKNHLNM